MAKWGGLGLFDISALLRFCIPAMAAEGNWSLGHLYIAGHTPRHSKQFVAKKDRRTFSVAVFVRLRHPTTVITVEGGGEEGSNRERQGQGTKAPQLTGARFVEMVRERLMLGRVGGARASSTRLAHICLVVDKAAAHTSKLFKSFAEASGIEVIVLPTRSPDLDPLDYGVFGAVKQAWEKKVTAGRLGWDGQKQALLEVLSGWNADRAIMALPERLQKCIASRGGHFEI